MELPSTNYNSAELRSLADVRRDLDLLRKELVTWHTFRPSTPLAGPTSAHSSTSELPATSTPPISSVVERDSVERNDRAEIRSGDEERLESLKQRLARQLNTESVRGSEA